MTAQQASPPPDGIELVPDGTVRFTVDGEVWHLRRPKLVEFRELRKLQRDLDNVRLDAFAQERVEEPLGADATTGEKTERLLALKDRTYRLEERMSAINVGWLESTLTGLADRPLPPSDDWPSGIDSFDVIMALVHHWRNRPLPSGGS